MRININIKQLSKRGRRIKPVTFDYEESFDTVEDFIKATVKIMYDAFMAKEAGTIDSEAGAFRSNDHNKDTQNLSMDNSRPNPKVLTDEQIKKYIEDFNPLDKAGAYGLQELPDYFHAKTKGSANNVIGLPVEEILEDLKEF